MDLGKIDAAFSEMRQEQQKKDEELNVWKEQMKNLVEKQETERKEMIAMLEIRDERIEKLEQDMIRMQKEMDEMKTQVLEMKCEANKLKMGNTLETLSMHKQMDITPEKNRRSRWADLEDDTPEVEGKMGASVKEKVHAIEKKLANEEVERDVENDGNVAKENKDENDSIEEEEKKEPRGKDSEEEDNGQEFKEQKRKKKKNKKAKKDEDQFMAGKEKLKGEIEIRAEEGGTGRRVSLDDLYEMMKKYKLTSREFKAAIHTKMQELEGRCVDARCVDGVTKDVEDFLSEFGQEFERYLKDEIKNARKEQ